MTNDVELYQIQDILRSVERLNLQCEDNMKRLNNMMLELKGLVCAIRPQVKKSGWYGDEIKTNPCENLVEICLFEKEKH